jgi:hypothetical protein
LYCSGKSKFHGARVLNARSDFDSFVRKGLRDIKTLSRIGLSDERSRNDENGQNGVYTLKIKFQKLHGTAIHTKTRGSEGGKIGHSR